MLSMAVIRNILHVHHPHMHPADAVLLVFSLLFVFIPLMIFLYTLFLLILSVISSSNV